jgi:hypothetical protein
LQNRATKYSILTSGRYSFSLIAVGFRVYQGLTGYLNAAECEVCAN